MPSLLQTGDSAAFPQFDYVCHVTFQNADERHQNRPHNHLPRKLFFSFLYKNFERKKKKLNRVDLRVSDFYAGVDIFFFKEFVWNKMRKQKDQRQLRPAMQSNNPTIAQSLSVRPTPTFLNIEIVDM